MTPITQYIQDGAGHQARAVLMALQGRISDTEGKDTTVARWENCREQGYIVMSSDKAGKQLNIAFFEHRNSDAIHALKWLQSTLNTPTIDSAEFGDLYKDKWDTSHSVDGGEYQKMAEWIHEQITEHMGTSEDD